MNYKLLVFSLGLSVISLVAKSQPGVFLSADDFVSQRTSDGADCKRWHIRLHELLGTSHFVVINGKRKTTYKKSSVYGYRNCKNETFRFYKQGIYRIAEPGHFFIYTQVEVVSRSKGHAVRVSYFFSVGPSGDILPLTLANLKYANRGNTKYLDQLDLYFTAGNVDAYDRIRKTFIVNYLFSKTLN